MPSDFTPLERTSVSVDVVARIKDLILEGRLRPGQRLPSERALADALGISRPTMREGLRALAALNILETRQGSGTYVSSPDAGQLLEPLRFALAMFPGGPRDVLELRMVLEPQAAAWAAERATEGQVDELRGLTAAGHGAAGDLERFAALDAELHTAVANAAGNAVAAHVLTSLRALATRSRRLALRTQQARARTADDHGRIVEAIAGHAPDDARSAMAGHLHALRDGSARLARRGERHER